MFLVTESITKKRQALGGRSAVDAGGLVFVVGARSTRLPTVMEGGVAVTKRVAVFQNISRLCSRCAPHVADVPRECTWSFFPRT